MHKPDKAAGPVATVLNFAAIGIEDAIAKISFGVQGGVNQKDLVAADTKLPMSERAGAGGGHVNGLPDPV